MSIHRTTDLLGPAFLLVLGLSPAVKADQPATAFALAITFGKGGGRLDLSSDLLNPLTGGLTGTEGLSLSKAEGAQTAVASASAVRLGPASAATANSGASSNPDLGIASTVTFGSLGFEFQVFVQPDPPG